MLKYIIIPFYSRHYHAGQMSIYNAIPIIMGANIGTSVTNTLASLAHSTRSGEFKRAFAAATCHDFFNFLAVFTLLPIEILSRTLFHYGPLEYLAKVLTPFTMGVSVSNYKSPFKMSLKFFHQTLSHFIESFTSEQWLHHSLLIGFSILIIILSLSGIVKTMKGLVLRKVEKNIKNLLSSSGIPSMILGMVITICVQSSSITTSIVVPLAGVGLLTLKQVYPITLGANIGTTITALIASMAISGPSLFAARQIALVHLGFNLFGILIWYIPSFTRNTPLFLAQKLADISAHSRKLALLYVVIAFYLFPAFCFFIMKAIN